MVAKNKISAILTGLIGMGLSLGIASIAQSQVQIDRIVFPDPNVRNRTQVANLYVPDQDTNQPAYGGRLRVYDVHIAKMFESTYYECRTTESRRWVQIVWRYYRGNRGQGAYTISCDRANQVVREYGLMNQTETSLVIYYRARNNVELPTLDITGDKITPWLELVRTFRPEGMD